MFQFTATITHTHINIYILGEINVINISVPISCACHALHYYLHTVLASQWESLESVALQRQHQARMLGGLYKQLRSCQRSQRTWCDQLEHQRYDSMQHLEHRIQVLQVCLIDNRVWWN